MTAAALVNYLDIATVKPLTSRGCVNVTPSDTPLNNVALQLLVRGEGDLVVTGLDGVDTTIVLSEDDVPYYHPSVVTTVKAATTATGIIAYT